METGHYDLLIAGGGIAGSTLARAMALSGARVLVVEKERNVTDRIRGEIIMPWGCVEAAELGIHDLLRSGCANDVPGESIWVNATETSFRDFSSTTPHGKCGLSFYHPEMQELLLAEAMARGADVRRGASIRTVRPGSKPSAEIAFEAGTEHITTRLIIGADGRESRLATMLGFERNRDPTELFVGGFQLADFEASRMR